MSKRNPKSDHETEEENSADQKDKSNQKQSKLPSGITLQKETGNKDKLPIISIGKKTKIPDEYREHLDKGRYVRVTIPTRQTQRNKETTDEKQKAPIFKRLQKFLVGKPEPEPEKADNPKEYWIPINELDFANQGKPTQELVRQIFENAQQKTDEHIYSPLRDVLRISQNRLNVCIRDIGDSDDSL